MVRMRTIKKVETTYFNENRTVCTTDGFILEMFGPYLGTSNDASIMRDLLTNNKDFLSLLRKGDCFVVDRGFRDVVSLLQEKGFVVRMPSCKKINQSQLSTEECNSSRLVTKIRWVVESVHGVLKQKWRFLREEISNQSLVKVKPYFEIASALHNLYGKKILCDVGNEEVVAQKILSGLKKNNEFNTYIQENSLVKKRRNFEKLNEAALEDFPKLTENDLEILTLGKYQIAQSLAYISEHYDNHFPLSVSKIESDIILVKIQSRHISSKKYNVFIRYIPNSNSIDGIKGWTSNCQNGLRTVGCCVHVCSVVYYLSYL